LTQDVRRLSALMITDMVGYTRLSQRDEALALRLLNEHNDLVRDSVESHGGREVKQTGDGFFVEFPSALQAVSCSIDIQRRLYDRNAKADEINQFRIRIGLHLGDVVHREGDVFGDGVNITSRIEPLALPGGVCLSQSIQAQVWNKIDRPLESLGAQELKNVDLPMEVFRVVLPWEEKAKKQAAERAEGLDRTRLAVLPMANISQDPDDVYFADGMTEELIYTLSRIKGLRVIAQTSIMAYRNSAKTIREIGRELNVGTILEGSVRKAGDRVRITTQLIDVATEEHLWAERYDRELADVFEIQSEISIEVAKGLKSLLKAAVVSAPPAPKPAPKPTERIDAYTAYLKGRHYWNRRTKTAVLQALEKFQFAIEVDPKFAKAYSGIADCYSVLANHGHESNDVALPKAKDAAKKALELDPNLAEAHASLGLAYLQFKSNPVKAEAEFKEAIRLNPSYATARQWYSMALNVQMRLEEALEHGLKSIELDPMAHIMHVNVAMTLRGLGRHEEAREHYKRAIELEPDYESAYVDLANIDMALWNWSSAESTLEAALERNPNNAEALLGKATLQLILGHEDEALASASRARQVSPDSAHIAVELAQVLRGANRLAQAVELLEEVLANGAAKPGAAITLVFCHLEAGRIDKARCVLRDAEDTPASKLPAMVLWHAIANGMIAAASGDREEARRRSAEIAEYSLVSTTPSSQAMISFLLEDLDDAFAHVDKAMASHDPSLPGFAIEPLLDPYRDDDRFRQMLEVMGLAKVAKAV